MRIALAHLEDAIPGKQPATLRRCAIAHMLGIGVNKIGNGLPVENVLNVAHGVVLPVVSP